MADAIEVTYLCDEFHVVTATGRWRVRDTEGVKRVQVECEWPLLMNHGKHNRSWRNLWLGTDNWRTITQSEFIDETRLEVTINYPAQRCNHEDL